MKRYGFGSILGLVVLSASAQEIAVVATGDSAPPVNAPLTATPASAGAAALPEGVTTEQNPLKVAYLNNGHNVAAVFRPSPNMPEIVNEVMLQGLAKSGKQADKVSQFIGYMPKLKVLPCAKGCEGSDYDKAVKAFVKGYSANSKNWKERGEMIVQVRWFNSRPFLQRQLPYGADLFGVSFMLEGKVISIGKSSGVGTSISAHELAGNIGGRISTELALSLGMGAKPPLLLPEGRDEGMSAKFMNASASVNDALGVEDVRPRIEPATEAHAVLMPAIDGIKPNEINPLDKMYYLNSWKY